MKRSAERLEEIDTFLRDNYKLNGGRYCADSLGEKLPYISSRVQHIGLVGNSKKAKSAKPEEILVLEGKIFARDREIEQLMDLVKHYKKIKSELLKENEKLIHEKVKWKLAKNAKENV